MVVSVRCSHGSAWQTGQARHSQASRDRNRNNVDVRVEAGKQGNLRFYAQTTQTTQTRDAILVPCFVESGLVAMSWLFEVVGVSLCSTVLTIWRPPA